ncbi:MAG: diguanylate cyclase [Proteobacteria bacterium]|nr:diguanylate cyclase [Pseudomonadota bacterium]
MTTLEFTIVNIRHGWRVSRTFIFTGAFAAAFVLGLFSDSHSDPKNRVLPLVLFGMWAAVFGIQAHRRFSSNVALSVQRRADLELGLLLVVATHAVVQMAGGLSSPLYPLVFVLIAFLVVYTAQWVGFALVATAIAIEFLLVFFGATHTELFEVVIHSIFIIFFALMNLVFTRTEVARMRRRTQRQVEEAKAAMASDARDFRLTVPAQRQAGSLTREEEEARLSRSSVSEVRRSMYHHVDLLKRTMGLHTCVVLWLDAHAEALRILECVSDADKVTTRNIIRGEGVLGAIMESQKPLRLKGLRPGYPGLAYYENEVPVTDFLGVPVIDSGCLRGVLCADRCDGRMFTEVEMKTLAASVESLLRIIVNERIFSQLEKAKSEQSKLLAASKQLARALTENDVVEAALEAAGQIAPFDIAAVALVNEKGRMVVDKATGKGTEEIEGLKVSPSSSLAAAALKNRHFLPYRGEFDPKQQIIFGKKERKAFAKIRSAIVLPLVASDEPLGTLTLASRTASAYGEEVRTTLQVMTNQLGTALQNARMVKRLEEMATTDGLTNLANHRVFQEELDKKIASANRFHKELSVVLCDVDKFKDVNDKYGHPVGDTVLKGLADTLRRSVVRDTDLPARYGGEEFVVLCEGTSTDGAVKLAERIRKDLENQVFRTDKSEFNVTISMGVATFPFHARTREDLVERADAALYMAKESGRNQVQIWSKGMDKA